MTTQEIISTAKYSDLVRLSATLKGAYQRTGISWILSDLIKVDNRIVELSK